MTDTPGSGGAELPPYVIEGARSSRARCKTCRRAIAKGALRIGIRIEGPFGAGYLWHHLACAARRSFERVEEAYALEAWKEAKEPPGELPSLSSLAEAREKSEERRRQQKELPYVDEAPTGRARCKHCGEPIDKGAVRVALGRRVEFGSQVRTTAIHVHARCVREALEAEDSATEAAGLADALRANSGEDAAERVHRALAEIGPLD